MDDIYVTAIVIGVIGTIGAFILNMIFDYTDDDVSTWVLTLIAFIVGSYVGERLSRRRAGG